MINYGGEGGAYVGSLLVHDNQFISHGDDNAKGVVNWTGLSVVVSDNDFHNVRTLVSGSAIQSGNILKGLAEDDRIAVRVSGDAAGADPAFVLIVDGVKIAPSSIVTADHADGEWQTFTFAGDWGADGPGRIALRYVNDDGAPARNLYVDWVEANGVRHEPTEATYFVRGEASAGRELMDETGRLVFDTADLIA
jgi:hypothetical protein